jgi:DNA ligase 1
LSQFRDCVCCCAAGGYGSFLLAIYDADSEEYQSISKIGTGFSEELLKEVSAAMKEHVIAAPPRYYRRALPVLPGLTAPAWLWRVARAAVL